MKKLTKNSLIQMTILLPGLDEEDQKSILGGTATTAIPYDYTGSVPEPTTVATSVDPYAVTGSMPTATTTSTVPATATAIPTATTTTTVAPTGSYTFDEMNQMMDSDTWNGGVVEGIGYVGGVSVVTGFYTNNTSTTSSDSSLWDDFCDYCTSVKDAAESLIPDAVTVNTSFDFAFLGGGNYDVGYAFVFKGPDAGNVYSYDTYSFALGLHAEASLNVGVCYYTGKDEDFSFVKAFGGKDASLEGDYMGGFSFGSGSLDGNENYLNIFSYGYGASIGGAMNLGYSNVKQVW